MSASAEALGKSLKEEGNVLYRQRAFRPAIAKYMQAAEADPSNAATYFNNVAAACIECADYPMAAEYSEKVLQMDNIDATTFEKATSRLERSLATIATDAAMQGKPQIPMPNADKIPAIRSALAGSHKPYTTRLDEDPVSIAGDTVSRWRKTADMSQPCRLLMLNAVSLRQASLIADFFSKCNHDIGYHGHNAPMLDIHMHVPSVSMQARNILVLTLLFDSRSLAGAGEDGLFKREWADVQFATAQLYSSIVLFNSAWRIFRKHIQVLVTYETRAQLEASYPFMRLRDDDTFNRIRTFWLEWAHVEVPGQQIANKVKRATVNLGFLRSDTEVSYFERTGISCPDPRIAGRYFRKKDMQHSLWRANPTFLLCKADQFENAVDGGPLDVALGSEPGGWMCITGSEVSLDEVIPPTISRSYVIGGWMAWGGFVYNFVDGLVVRSMYEVWRTTQSVRECAEAAQAAVSSSVPGSSRSADQMDREGSEKKKRKVMKSEQYPDDVPEEGTAQYPRGPVGWVGSSRGVGVSFSTGTSVLKELAYHAERRTSQHSPTGSDHKGFFAIYGGTVGDFEHPLPLWIAGSPLLEPRIGLFYLKHYWFSKCFFSSMYLRNAEDIARVSGPGKVEYATERYLFFTYQTKNAAEALDLLDLKCNTTDDHGSLDTCSRYDTSFSRSAVSTSRPLTMTKQRQLEWLTCLFMDCLLPTERITMCASTPVAVHKWRQAGAPLNAVSFLLIAHYLVSLGRFPSFFLTTLLHSVLTDGVIPYPSRIQHLIYEGFDNCAEESEVSPLRQVPYLKLDVQVACSLLQTPLVGPEFRCRLARIALTVPDVGRSDPSSALRHAFCLGAVLTPRDRCHLYTEACTREAFMKILEGSQGKDQLLSCVKRRKGQLNNFELWLPAVIWENDYDLSVTIIRVDMWVPIAAARSLSYAVQLECT
jgi:hypothetical protein